MAAMIILWNCEKPLRVPGTPGNKLTAGEKKIKQEFY